jgi:ubiquitin conjugation factor E4 B
MMRFMSRDFPEPFLRPELIDKVATMINSFIEKLAGKRCQELKVSDPEKYSFNPKELLTNITDTLINFAKYPTFIEAMVREERYFSLETLQKVAFILQQKIHKPESYMSQFRDICAKSAEKFREISEVEEDFEDAPDQMLDQIFFSLMKDPLKLPSGQTVDRSTIERHLLNDPTNPFNRMPLKIEDCVPDVELKNEIEQWKNEQRAKKRAAAAAAQQ